MSLSPMFLFEVAGKMPTIEYMYVSGLILALIVFGATYFHRQVGLITLFLVGLICARDIETPEVMQQALTEAGQNYIEHWNYSSRITFALSIILFFTAIILKRRLKRKIKLD
jgi:hypothetical protein